MQDTYVLLKDVKTITVNKVEKTSLVFLPAEERRVEYKWFGLRKKIVEPKPNRWIDKAYYADLELYDRKSYWQEESDIRSKEYYMVDEKTKEVFRKATVDLKMVNGDWVRYGYYDSNEEAQKIVLDLIALSKETFI